MAATIPPLSLSHKLESGFIGCSCSLLSAHPRAWSAATIPWHLPVFFPTTRPRLPHHQRSTNATPPRPSAVAVRAFRRSDFDGFARRVASGEALRDAWLSANEGIEQLAFEARRATERMDRRYAVSNRIGSAARAAASRAREIDLELGIGRRWRAFSMDFSRSLPRYRKELSGFLGTPIGKGSMMVFFFWFASSGWLFRLFVLAIWVLPFAAPLLIGKFANSFAIQDTSGPETLSARVLSHTRQRLIEQSVSPPPRASRACSKCRLALMSLGTHIVSGLIAQTLSPLSEGIKLDFSINY